MSELKNLPSVNIEMGRLPSKGTLYPEDFTASYRSYSFGELQRVATSKMNEKQVIELVLLGVKTNMNKNLFTLSDALYIGLLRKISSLGTAKIQVPFTNPATKKTEYHIMSLSDVEFSDMEAPKLPLSVDLSDGKEYKFNPLLVRDYLKLVRLKKDKDPISLYAAMCIDHKFDDAFEFFNSTESREDGEILTEIDSLLHHGIKPIKIPYKFDVDGEEKTKYIKVRLEERQALLLPFREQGKSIRSKIRFGDAS